MSLVSAIPNLLSGLRLLMAPGILFIPREILFPYFCIIGLTDMLDGFFARKFNAFSTLGLYLDPIADKMVALFCGYLFFSEGAVSLVQLFILFSRDFSLMIFALYLLYTNKWKNFAFRSFLCGKISTGLQAAVFSFLALNIEVISAWYVVLLVFAIASFFELRLRLLHELRSQANS